MASTNGFIETSSRDLLYVIFRHKWKIIIVTLLIAFGVAAYTYAVQELYKSEAKVLIKLGRESLAVDPSVSGPTMAMLADRNHEVRSEMQILDSQELVDEVVNGVGADLVNMKPDELDEGGLKGLLRSVIRGPIRGLSSVANGVLVSLDLKEKLTEEELAVKVAMERLTVEQEKNASVINVSYEAPGAEPAQKTLSALLTLYMRRHVEVHSGQASPDFFEGQAGSLRDALEAEEAKLEAFRQEHGIVNLESQKDALLEHINMLKSDSTALDAQAAGSAARLARLQDALSRTSKTHESSVTVRNVNPVVDNLRQVLVELRNQEIDLAGRYPDDYRPLVQLREKIKETQGVIDAQEKTRTEVTRGIDSVYQDLSVAVAEEASQLESKRAAFEAMQDDLDGARSELDKLTGLEVKLASLQRNVDIAADEYEKFRDNLNRSKKYAALDDIQASNVSIIQQPSKPLGPSFPNKPLNIGLGLLLGLFTGVFLAFVLDYLDDSLNTPEKASRKLGVPVLATVSNEEFKACT
jgi:uncharacterized protein involved in exopolysaccharide biosynthesis